MNKRISVKLSGAVFCTIPLSTVDSCQCLCAFQEAPNMGAKAKKNERQG